MRIETITILLTRMVENKFQPVASMMRIETSSTTHLTMGNPVNSSQSPVWWGLKQGRNLISGTFPSFQPVASMMRIETLKRGRKVVFCFNNSSQSPVWWGLKLLRQDLTKVRIQYVFQPVASMMRIETDEGEGRYIYNWVIFQPVASMMRIETAIR